MRRALGLTGDRAGRSSPPPPERLQAGPPTRPAGRSFADKPRRRFVPDGAVPVTLVNRHRPDDADGPSASRAAIEAALQDERAARAKAERSLQEALATVHDLQTKLGHAELARREASGTAEAARAAADTLRTEHQERELRWHEDLGAERGARLLAEAALAEATRAREPAQRTRVSALVFLHSGFDWLPERRFGVHLHCGPAWIPLRPTAYGAWLPEHQLSKCLLPGVSDRSMTGRVGSTAALVYLRLTTIEKPD